MDSNSFLVAAIAGAFAALSFLIAAAGDAISTDKPFGWLGAILLAAVSSFALWRAGSVRAWKTTAQAREERIDDLTSELSDTKSQLAEIRLELKIPERIEGIIQLMGETAVHQDAAASKRLEGALKELRTTNQIHEKNAELRADRIINAIREAK